MRILILLGSLLMFCGCHTLDRTSTTEVFHEHIRKGHTDIVREMISNGSDVNSYAETGATPLILAIANKHEDIVALLLRNGADVNMMSTGRVVNAPLHEAVFNSVSMTKLLLKNDAHTDIRDGDGNTPMEYAAIERKYVMAMLLHLKGGSLEARPSRPDEFNRSMINGWLKKVDQFQSHLNGDYVWGSDNDVRELLDGQWMEGERLFHISGGEFLKLSESGEPTLTGHCHYGAGVLFVEPNSGNYELYLVRKVNDAELVLYNPDTRDTVLHSRLK